MEAGTHCADHDGTSPDMKSSRPLRIFLCCQQDGGQAPHPVPAYRFWREYFFQSFAECGHELLEAPDCDWAKGLMPMDASTRSHWLQKTWSAALRWLHTENSRRPIDLFLSYLFPQQIDAASLREIGSLGIPKVNFFCDNVREFRAIPKAFHGFDLHWVPEFKALKMYQHAGLPALHAPMPCWVPLKFRTPPVEETYPASFIGTKDELRASLFASAITLGLDVKLWGRGWIDEPHEAPLRNPGSLIANQVAFLKQHGAGGLYRKVIGRLSPAPSVDFDFSPYASATASEGEYWNVLRESLVCLGVNRFPSPRNSPDRPDTYSRLRDIEAPMVGACYLTEWTEGLDHLYEIGAEIETFRDAAELKEKADALRYDPERRQRLRQAGQRRALAQNTIANTIGLISERLGFS